MQHPWATTRYEYRFTISPKLANSKQTNIKCFKDRIYGSRVKAVATLTQELDLSINGISLKRVNGSKCLGVEIDEFLTWDANIASVSKKVSSGIGVINKIKPFVPTSNLISVYQSIVEPYLDYCSVVWDDISDKLTDKLQILQNRAARVITGADYRMHTELGWSSLKEKRNKQKALMMFTMAPWQHGSMAAWQHGSMAAWLDLAVRFLFSGV